MSTSHVNLPKGTHINAFKSSINSGWMKPSHLPRRNLQWFLFKGIMTLAGIWPLVCGYYRGRHNCPPHPKFWRGNGWKLDENGCFLENDFPIQTGYQVPCSYFLRSDPKETKKKNNKLELGMKPPEEKGHFESRKNSANKKITKTKSISSSKSVYSEILNKNYTDTLVPFNANSEVLWQQHHYYSKAL